MYVCMYVCMYNKHIKDKVMKVHGCENKYSWVTLFQWHFQYHQEKPGHDGFFLRKIIIVYIIVTCT